MSVLCLAGVAINRCVDVWLAPVQSDIRRVASDRDRAISFSFGLTVRASRACRAKTTLSTHSLGLLLPLLLVLLLAFPDIRSRRVSPAYKLSPSSHLQSPNTLLPAYDADKLSTWPLARPRHEKTHAKNQCTVITSTPASLHDKHLYIRQPPTAQ